VLNPRKNCEWGLSSVVAPAGIRDEAGTDGQSVWNDDFVVVPLTHSSVNGEANSFAVAVWTR